jgi:hypothetical protein
MRVPWLVARGYLDKGGVLCHAEKMRTPAKKKLFVLVISCAVAVCAALGGEGAMAAPASKDRGRDVRLLVKNIAAGQEISDHEWGLVRVEVGVERDRAPAVGRPSRSARSALRVKVDGKEVPCALEGSRTGYEGKKAYTYRTLGVPFGSTPGPRTITVSLNRLSKTVSVSYRPKGQLEICGLYDDQALFGPGDVVVNWLGCYLVKESIKVFVNGKEIPSEMGVVDGRPELVEGRVKPRDMLVTGTNTLRIEAVDIRGDRREREIHLHYYPENRVPLGDLFVLSLGLGEPKSGPFYDAVVDGGSLVKKEDLSGPPWPERMGGQLVVPGGRVALARFQAIAEGESIIRTTERQYPTDLPQEMDHVRVLVSRGQARMAADRTPIAAEQVPVKTGEAAGAVFERYADNLFACALPKGWYRIENPGKDQHVYGVFAYGPALGEQSGLKLSVEFYAADNLLGYQTEEYFTQSLLKKGFSGRGEREGGHSGETTVAGRHAKVLERELGLVAKTAPSFSARTPVVERVVAVPADGGFYVLQFRAPLEGLSKNSAIFAAVLDSFRPLK